MFLEKELDEPERAARSSIQDSLYYKVTCEEHNLRRSSQKTWSHGLEYAVPTKNAWTL